MENKCFKDEILSNTGKRYSKLLISYPISIIHSASADASADKSAAKYSEMSAILGSFHHIWPRLPSLCSPHFRCRLESDF